MPFAALFWAACLAAAGTPAERLDYARADQRDVLAGYSLASQPDLSAQGLVLGADGAYRKGDRFPTAEELAQAVQDWIVARLDAGARREWLAWVAQRAGGAGSLAALAGLSDPALYLLADHLAGREPPALADRPLGALVAELNSAVADKSTEEVEEVLRRYFGYGGPVVVRRQLEQALDGRLVPQKEFGEHVLPGPASAARAVIRYSPKKDGFHAGEQVWSALKDIPKPMAREAAREMLPLMGFRNPEFRWALADRAGDLESEAYMPLLAKALGDPWEDVRRRAKLGLRDWIEEVGGSPEAVAAVVDGAARQAAWTWSWRLAGDLSYAAWNRLNTADDPTKRRFAAATSEPRAVYALLLGSHGEHVSRTTGLHSSEAKAASARLTQISGGRPLHTLLADPELKPREKARVLARLARYQQLAGMARREPREAAKAADLLFATDGGKDAASLPEDDGWALDMARGGQSFQLLSSQVFTAAGQLWQGAGPAFADTLLASVESREGPRRDAALFYLEANAGRLTPAQRARLGKRIRLAEGAAMPQPRWLKEFQGPLKAAVVMTQAGWARRFVERLEARGYRKVAAEGAVTRLARAAGRGVELTIEVLPERDGGWAQDRGQVTARLAAYWKDPGYRAVAYRGHSGEYDPGAVWKGGVRGKAFFDLGCGSEYKAALLAADCADCLHFWTTGTGEGHLNEVVLPEALEAIAETGDAAAIDARLARRLGEQHDRFTGNWSRQAHWRDRVNDSKPPPEPGVIEIW